MLRSSTINGVAATSDQNSQHGSTSTTVTSSSTSTSPGVYVTISFTSTETAPWSQSTNTSTTYGSMGNVVISNQVFNEQQQRILLLHARLRAEHGPLELGDRHLF